MIPVSIESLVVGFMPSPSIVALRPNEGKGDDDIERVLPIWIGPMEATCIAAALDDAKAERPLTHELAANMVHVLGGAVSRVCIDRVEGTTFYATIYLRSASGMFTRVDARPSDAIAMAIQADAPLFVDEKVLEMASFPRAFKPGAEKKIEMEEFHKFVEGLKPEDFVTQGNNDK